VSSRSDSFECLWEPSRRLLLVYVALQVAVLCCLYLVDIPVWAQLLLVLFCAAHAGWVVPRHLLLATESSYRGLYCGPEGWRVYSKAAGWQAIELHPDSLALPLMVFLRFRIAGQVRVRTSCVARDSLPRPMHRRLRVRLKFSRHRWAAAK
jgi:toxin CptA